MSGRGYHGDKFDARIRDALARGLSTTEVAAALRVSSCFVAYRADPMGLRAQRLANGKRRHLDVVRRGGRRPREIAASLVSQDRDTTAALVRSIRYHEPSGTFCIDPDHSVACLHERGLTLVEIEDHLGVPQIEAVAVIRHFAGMPT